MSPFAPSRNLSRVRLRWAEVGAILPLLLYSAVIFALSHTSQPPLPDVLLQVSDKILHGAEYCGLGFFWARALSGERRKVLVLGWIAATLYGLTDEIHQAFVPGRDASLLDWSADAIGAAFGAGLAVAFDRLLRSGRPGIPRQSSKDGNLR